MLKQKSLPELSDIVVQGKEISVVSTLHQAALMPRAETVHGGVSGQQ